VDFNYSAKTEHYISRVRAFMDAHIYPNEPRYYAELEKCGVWETPRLVEELKPAARAAGLWNLFLPESELGAGLTNLEYAPLAEEMGRAPWAPEVFNCAAPDTGNMEVLARYGTPEQKGAWLTPLLEGKTRSCFAMTEPGRIKRCHQHSGDDQPTRRPLCRQRSQVVFLRRRRSPLCPVHLHGQDRPRSSRQA
jgi:acyl-CoA dehydrogenase